jgi:hypothetical protein
MSELEEPREPRPDQNFAHASEAELARILDFYQVAWEYEPQVFPILWDLEGNVLESFAPDFYLPDMDLFLEMTTLQQRLVRKKNRKVRRLRELYPHVRIKLFYARDFRALMLKYGRAALVSELSGTVGQFAPGPVEGPIDDGSAGGLSGLELSPVPERRSRSARRRAARRAAAAYAAGSPSV